MGYSWLCAQGLYLVSSGLPLRVSGIEPGVGHMQGKPYLLYFSPASLCLFVSLVLVIWGHLLLFLALCLGLVLSRAQRTLCWLNPEPCGSNPGHASMSFIRLSCFSGLLCFLDLWFIPGSAPGLLLALHSGSFLVGLRDHIGCWGLNSGYCIEDDDSIRCTAPLWSI